MSWSDIIRHAAELLVEVADQLDGQPDSPLDSQVPSGRNPRRRRRSLNAQLYRNNTSGYREVTWVPSVEKWQAIIWVDGRNRYVGRFDSPIEAAMAYDAAAREYYGQSARINFPNFPGFSYSAENG